MHILPICGGPARTEGQVTPGLTCFLRILGSPVLLHTLVLPASWDYFLCTVLCGPAVLCFCLRLSNFLPGNAILSVFQGKNPRVLPDILLSYPHKYPSIRPVGLYFPSHLRRLRSFFQHCPKIIPWQPLSPHPLQSSVSLHDMTRHDRTGRSQWLPHCSTAMPDLCLPQGLCTYNPFCQELCFPRYLQG